MSPPRDPVDFARAPPPGAAGTFCEGGTPRPLPPIRAWQVWNEPNIPAWWRPEPNAEGYVRLLRAAATAIHFADPAATVVSAGMPESQGGIPQRVFFRQMFAPARRPTPRGARLRAGRRRRGRSGCRRRSDGRRGDTRAAAIRFGWASAAVGPRSASRFRPASRTTALRGLAAVRPVGGSWIRVPLAGPSRTLAARHLAPLGRLLGATAAPSRRCATAEGARPQAAPAYRAATRPPRAAPACASPRAPAPCASAAAGRAARASCSSSASRAPAAPLSSTSAPGASRSLAHERRVALGRRLGGRTLSGAH